MGSDIYEYATFYIEEITNSPDGKNKFKLYIIPIKDKKLYISLSPDGRMCCTQENRDKNTCKDEKKFHEIVLDGDVNKALEFEPVLIKKIPIKPA